MTELKAFVVVFLVRCLLSLGLIVAAQGETPSPETTDFQVPVEWLDQKQEVYLGLYAFGDKIGWGVTRQGPTEWEGKEVYYGEMEHNITYLAGEEEVEAQMSAIEYFSREAPYPFLGGRSISTQGDYRQVIDFEIVDGRTQAWVQDGSGGKTTKDLGVLDHTYDEYIGSDYWLGLEERQVGDAKTFETYDFEEFRPDTERYVIEAISEEDAGLGKVMDVKMITSQIKTSLKWKHGGNFLSLAHGPEFVIKVETEDEAKKKSDVKVDMFESGIVSIDSEIGEPDEVIEMEVKITGGRLDGLANHAMQSVEISPDGKSAIVRVGPRHGKPLRATDEEINRALSETAEFPISDLRVQELAKELISGATTDREKANRIMDFIYSSLEYTETAEPLTVIDVISVMEGDCSEASMLFTALARASGLPARTIGGLVYMGDEYQAFGGHAWNEIVINGHWIPIDPTWNERLINGTHISFDPNDMGAMQSRDWKIELIDAKLR